MVTSRADGQLSGAGWMVRWRWHDDGSLEYRASHRMTDERWTLLAPDGTVTSLEVPASFMVSPREATPEEQVEIRRAHQGAWAAHGRRVTERDMAFDTAYDELAEEHRGAARMAWRTDGAPWTSSALLT